MVEKINLKTFTLESNMILVKPDPNYDFVEALSPEGKVKIYLSYEPEDDAKHVSITGKVLKVPSELKYYSELKTSKKGIDISPQEFESKMRNTMPFKTEINVSEGDVVFFNHLNQIDAELEGRLVNTDEYGYCMLMPYSSLYGKKTESGFTALNGYVIFIRDQKDATFESKSGLLVLQKSSVYGSYYGTVVSCDKRIDDYLDKSYDCVTDIQKGDRIIINPKFGYRIAYSIHAGDMSDHEIIRRKHILALIK